MALDPVDYHNFQKNSQDTLCWEKFKNEEKLAALNYAERSYFYFWVGIDRKLTYSTALVSVCFALIEYPYMNYEVPSVLTSTT